jgi:hypothetical protein
MKKLKLALDQIQVASFTVEMSKRSGGTVNGFDPGPDTDIGCGGGGGTDDGGSCRICLPVPETYTCVLDGGC